ncbi:MAG: hypothetical protein OEZ18_06805, partial [Candidatus Bathyarchaeota archaeon]|nr:hypothetical protein [Candidatus Bathyarchaeota archaeon]
RLPMASANCVKVGKAERACGVSTLTGTWWGVSGSCLFLLIQDPGGPSKQRHNQIDCPRVRNACTFNLL